jgi:hypothetical protein
MGAMQTVRAHARPAIPLRRRIHQPAFRLRLGGCRATPQARDRALDAELGARRGAIDSSGI